MTKYINRAIFLDRDGIINKSIIHNQISISPRNLKEFKINHTIKK